MRITSTAHATPKPSGVSLTGNATDNYADGVRRHQVEITYDFYLYASAAELSELGHRFIELAALAEEREQGVEAVA